jgi:hypothetical protein
MSVTDFFHQKIALSGRPFTLSMTLQLWDQPSLVPIGNATETEGIQIMFGFNEVHYQNDPAFCLFQVLIFEDCDSIRCRELILSYVVAFLSSSPPSLPPGAISRLNFDYYLLHEHQPKNFSSVRFVSTHDETEHGYF